MNIEEELDADSLNTLCEDFLEVNFVSDAFVI